MSEHELTTQETRNEQGKRRWIAMCSCGWTGVVAKKQETALKVGMTDHVERQLPPCPTPHKRRFRSQQTAEQEMRLFWRTSGKGKAMPTRVYKCPCGGWHTTSKPARQRAAIR